MSVEKPNRQDYYKLLVDALREDDDHIELIKYLVENSLSEAEAELKLDSCDLEQIENLKTKISEAEQNKDSRQLFLDELRMDLASKFNTQVVDQIIENFECEAVYFLNDLDVCKDEFEKTNLKLDLLASLCKEGRALEFNKAVKYIEDLNSKKNNPDSSFKQRLIDELTEINLKEKRFKNKLAIGLSESDEYIREGIKGILAYVNTAKAFTHSNTDNELNTIVYNINRPVKENLVQAERFETLEEAAVSTEKYNEMIKYLKDNKIINSDFTFTRTQSQTAKRLYGYFKRFNDLGYFKKIFDYKLHGLINKTLSINYGIDTYKTAPIYTKEIKTTNTPNTLNIK